jgi:hypothetical protein
MRTSLIAAAAVCATVLAGGCTPKGIDGVKPGMMPVDVYHVMGRHPVRKIRGDGVDLDKETHVYPTGRVHYVKKQVVLVEKNETDEPTITEKVEGQKKRDTPPPR